MKASVFAACVAFAIANPLAADAKCIDTRVQSPNPGSYSAGFGGVAGVSADDIWAVGNQSTPTALETLIEHWDGSAWSIVPSPNAPGAARTWLTSVAAVSSTDVWAIGHYSMNGYTQQHHEIREHWDGTAWTASLHADDASIASMSSVPGDPNSVWAVGIWYDLCGYQRCPAQLIEHWNGSSWERVGSRYANGYLYGVLSLPHDTMWAVGYEENYQGFLGPTIRHRAFGKWSRVSRQGMAPDATPVAIGGTSDDNVWIAAYHMNSGFLVEHWDGTKWTKYQLPQPANTTVTSVSAGSSTDVWVAGWHQPSGYGGPEYPYLAHWDGSSWTYNIRSPIGSDQGWTNGLFQLPTGILTVGGDAPANAPAETFVTSAHC